MIRNYKFLLLFILISCNTVYASSSSSFLITKSAFNNYDFNKVLNQYNNEKLEKINDNLLDELIAAVIKENLDLANNISKNILSANPNNQEARLLSMVQAAKDNSKDKIKSYRLDDKKNKNNLLEFLFFDGDTVKNNSQISNAFLDIVKSSYVNTDSDSPLNYNFLLFYASLSIIIDERNFESIFIKGQLLQIIEKYFFAENTFLRIPKKSEYYLDAQINIAYNFFKENYYENNEEKILKIIKNNDENYELTKILADFYRIKKDYNKAIKIYSDLFKKNREDNWYIIYLRGICYERSGDWEKAEIDFLKSLKLKKDSPDVLNYLAYGWIERDMKIEKSFEMLTEAYNANPDSYYILDSLAWAHYKKKEYKKAAKLMETVIDMVPGEVISLDHLGDIYYAMNRKREAIFFWKQARDLADPEDDITDKILEKLRVYDAS